MGMSYDEWREARIGHHLYETNEGIYEHAERIVALEALVYDMWGVLNGMGLTKAVPDLAERIIQLDIPTVPKEA